MARWIITGLVVLNLLLGATVYMRTGGEKTAQAQIGGGRGSYATVGGYSGQQAVIYVLELNTGNLVAVKTDPINRTVTMAAKRNVGEDLKRLQ